MGRKWPEEQNMVMAAFLPGPICWSMTANMPMQSLRPGLGLGYSSFAYAIAAVSLAGVKRLALFHHEPGSDRSADR